MLRRRRGGGQAAWAAKERAIEEKGAAKVRAEEEKLAEENSGASPTWLSKFQAQASVTRVRARAAGGLSLVAYRERRVVVAIGLDCIVNLHHRALSLYRVHGRSRCLYF